MQALQKVSVLEGTLKDIPLLDLMQVLSLGRQFMSIELQAGDGTPVGAMLLKSGMLLDARAPKGSGKDAFFLMLGDTRAERFSVFRLVGQWHDASPLGKLDNLVLESAGMEAGPTPGQGPTPAHAPAPAHAPTPAPGPAPGPRPVAAPAPRTDAAAPRPAPARAPATPASTPRAVPATEAVRPAPPSAPRPAASPAPAAPRRAAAVSRGRIVALSSPKGGVGKTTLALNLGLALADRGVSVLLVDADPQGGLADSLTERVRQAPGVYDVLTGQRSLESCLLRTRVERLRILPAGRWPVEDSRSPWPGDAGAWGELLEEAARDAHVVLVDTAAGLHGVTTAVLRGCDEVVGVVQAEALGVRSFPALLAFLQGFAPEGRPRLSGVVVNMFQYEQRVSHAALHEALKGLPPDAMFQPVVPRDTALLEAAAAGLPVKLLSPRTPPALAGVFESLAAELSLRLGLERPPAHDVAPLVE